MRYNTIRPQTNNTFVITHCLYLHLKLHVLGDTKQILKIHPFKFIYSSGFSEHHMGKAVGTFHAL